MSTAPYILESVTIDILKKMAKDRIFVQQPGDNVRTLQERHILLRDTPDDRDSDSRDGERNIEKPALIVTYLGTAYPAQAGQNHSDDGRHTLLIQLIDDVIPVNSQRRKSYHYWLSKIRKTLQANPFRAELDPSVADIFLIQVQSISPAAKKPYTVHRQMRAALEVSAYVRESRT